MPCGCAATPGRPRCCCPNSLGRRPPRNVALLNALKFLGLFLSFLIRLTLILTLVWGKLVLSVYSYGKQCSRNRYLKPLLTFCGVFLICCLMFHELKFALLGKKCPITSIEVEMSATKSLELADSSSKDSLSKQNDVTSKSNVPSNTETGLVATSATVGAQASVKSGKESKESKESKELIPSKESKDTSVSSDLSKGATSKDLIVPNAKSVVNIKFKNPRVKLMELPYKEKTFSVSIKDENKKTLFEASSKFNVSAFETHALVVSIPSIVLEEYTI